MPMAAAMPSLIFWTCLPACLPDRLFNIRYLFFFANMPSCRWPWPCLISSPEPSCLPACRIAFKYLFFPFFLRRHAVMPMAAAISSLICWNCLPACRPDRLFQRHFSLFPNSVLFSPVPCRHAGLLPLSPLYLVRRRHAGMPDGMLDMGAILLYVVRRRDAGMPDVVVVPSVSCPAPACRHAGRGGQALIISSGTGMPACRTWDSCPQYLQAPACRHAGHGSHPSVCGPAPACRHAGRGSHALCISPGAGMPACWTW